MCYNGSVLVEFTFLGGFASCLHYFSDTLKEHVYFHQLRCCSTLNKIRFLSSGQGDRRVFTVWVWELHAPAAAVGWREEHYPRGQELSHQAPVWQHPACKASGPWRPASQPARCCNTGTTFPPEVILKHQTQPLWSPLGDQWSPERMKEDKLNSHKWGPGWTRVQMAPFIDGLWAS